MSLALRTSSSQLNSTTSLPQPSLSPAQLKPFQLKAAQLKPAQLKPLHSKQVRPSSNKLGPAVATGQPLLKYPPRLRTPWLPFAEEPHSSPDQLTPSTTDSTHSPNTHSPSTPSTASTASSLTPQQILMAQLARDVQRLENAGRVAPTQLGRAQTVFSSGCPAIDTCLPEGGYASGSVIEYLQHRVGSGATTLALATAQAALAQTDRFCLFVDWQQQFYPPAAAALGIDLKRLVIVRPESLADRLWAIDQALRCPAIVAVIAQVERLDDRAARRLQLAAERGGGLALLVRGTAARELPSWAEIQWLVSPVAAQSNHRQLQLELLRARGNHTGQSVRVQINASNGRLEPATAATAALAHTLAHPTNRLNKNQSTTPTAAQRPSSSTNRPQPTITTRATGSTRSPGSTRAVG